MKYNRHIQILKLINEKEIETQEELLFELKKLGYNITQATVSRDIKELGLMKLSTTEGRYRYIQYDSPIFSPNNRFIRIFKESALSLTYSQNMVVVKTFLGTASAAAAAIDAFKIPEVVGTIAGDDTIFVLTQDEETSKQVISKLKLYLEV